MRPWHHDCVAVLQREVLRRWPFPQPHSHSSDAGDDAAPSAGLADVVGLLGLVVVADAPPALTKSDRQALRPVCRNVRDALDAASPAALPSGSTGLPMVPLGRGS